MILAKFRSGVLCASNFMILPQIGELISSSELTSHEKSLENGKQELQGFAKNFGPKFCQNSWRAHFAQKKKTQCLV